MCRSGLTFSPVMFLQTFTRKLTSSKRFLRVALQTLMEDGKRELAVSMLPIVPEDSDSGRTYTCRVLNPAAPAGRQTSITINVQRECPSVCFLV